MSQPDLLDELESRLGYRFRDRSLLEIALTHRSWANEQGSEQHYERMEFLGDAVLGLLVSHWLYENHPEVAEGDLTKLKSFAVSRSVLARWAERLELGEALRLGVGEDRSGGRARRALLADAMESVFGALFLDGGMTPAHAVAEPWLRATFAEGDGEFSGFDPKTSLQELAQSQGLALPEYRHVAQEGPDHRRRFHVECWVGGRRLAAGAGRSKKQAEQMAAREALVILEVA